MWEFSSIQIRTPYPFHSFSSIPFTCPLCVLIPFPCPLFHPFSLESLFMMWEFYWSILVHFRHVFIFPRYTIHDVRILIHPICSHPLSCSLSADVSIFLIVIIHDVRVFFVHSQHLIHSHHTFIFTRSPIHDVRILIHPVIVVTMVFIFRYPLLYMYKIL